MARRYEQGELKRLYGKPYKNEDTQLKLGHAHNRAMRKMAKLFLAHVWVAARELTGQETPNNNPYITGRMSESGGRVHEHVTTWYMVLEANQDQAKKAV